MDTYPEGKKRSPLSIVLLVILIIVVALIGFWFVQKFFFGKNTPTSTSTNKTFSLNLSNPSDQTATTVSSTTVSGNTGVDSIVTIQLGANSQIVKTTEGSFSAKVSLNEGKNAIVITAFNPSTGESQTKTLAVLYLNEDLSGL